MGLGSTERERVATRTNDHASFEDFVRGQRDALVNLLRRRTRSEDEAQDVAQESLVRLMRYRDRPANEWAPLLYRIAINTLHDRGRRALSRRDTQHVSIDDDHGPELESSEPTHEQRLAAQQTLAHLQQAILGLPPRCREVYLLNRIEGMSYSEIASHCGIGVKAVEKHIGKALAALRRHLQERESDREKSR